MKVIVKNRSALWPDRSAPHHASVASRYVARSASEIANLPLNDKAPHVGGHAFAHKGGMHIDAVVKLVDALEVKPIRDREG